MSDRKIRIPRRQFIAALAAGAGAGLAGCSDTEPPTYGNILRMGDWLTYKTHRLLLPADSMAREYEHDDITNVPAIGSVDPGNPARSYFHPDYGPEYDRLHNAGFADWKLTVGGAVSRPMAFSMDDLQRLPSRTQITRHTCEEGWSAIAEWTGSPLRAVLEACGIREDARYVQFHAYDFIADGIDMLDAMHPQTILAYGMNGKPLPIGHGAPLRLRVERQLGYKSVKFLRHIEVTTAFDDNGDAGPLQAGWAWYSGI
jgi:DMSO/TMAO reductase YedYZ molybdopterin-dependent catalytic subunit